MGKVLIIYDSRTGNTEKMAHYVAEGARRVEGTEVRIKRVDEATKEDVLWADGIAVGTPTNMGIISWKLKRFFDDVLGELWGEIDGKIGCAFSSSGGWGGGNEIACMSVLTVLMNFGFLVFGVTDYVGKKFTLHYGAVVSGEPRKEEEIEACRRLGERLAQYVAAFFDGKKDLLEHIRHFEGKFVE
ncbi:flavodoxin family protein [Thermocrinis minervae]|uniref:NAD(P)H dehydrogenase (Quinone) n=1 Tax=Thermocrinis minervae TaxID=381751 RepID=A0A1M6QDW7_9AQUI|nr:flavodoxin domain-containing protein [Thermocrinis minervae]SHK18391.1 NAD(P)H dehydrogenase (quinone) [Thermocrinis minervae]